MSADVNSTLRLFQLCETLYWPQSFFLLLIIVQLSFSKKYINYFILSLCIDTQTHTNEHQTPTFGSELSVFRVPYRHNIHIVDFFPFVCDNQSWTACPGCRWSFLKHHEEKLLIEVALFHVYLYILCMCLHLCVSDVGEMATALCLSIPACNLTFSQQIKPIC